MQVESNETANLILLKLQANKIQKLETLTKSFSFFDKKSPFNIENKSFDFYQNNNICQNDTSCLKVEAFSNLIDNSFNLQKELQIQEKSPFQEELKKMFASFSLEIELRENQKVSIFFKNKTMHAIGLFINSYLNVFFDLPVKNSFLFLIIFLFLTIELIQIISGRFTLMFLLFFIFLSFVFYFLSNFKIKRTLLIQPPFNINYQNSENFMISFFEKVINDFGMKMHDFTQFKHSSSKSFMMCYYKKTNFEIDTLFSFKADKFSIKLVYFDTFAAKKVSLFLKSAKKIRQKIIQIAVDKKSSNEIHSSSKTHDFSSEKTLKNNLVSTNFDVKKTRQPRNSSISLMSQYFNIIPVKNELIFEEENIVLDKKPQPQTIEVQPEMIKKVVDPEFVKVLNDFDVKMTEYKKYASEVNSFRLVKEKINEFSLYTRDDPEFISKMCKLKMPFSVDQIKFVLTDLTKLFWYNPIIKDVKLIKKFDENSILYYMGIRTPFMVTERDFYQYSIWREMGVDNFILMCFSASDELYPKNNKFVRGIVRYTIWELQKIDDKHTHVTFLTRSNPFIAGLPLLFKKIAC